MSFFAALSSVEGLSKQFSAIEKAVKEFPALKTILQQVAPFLVVAVNSLYVESASPTHVLAI